MKASEQSIKHFLPLVKYAFRKKLPLRLELGSGLKRQGWVTVDRCGDPDIKIDILSTGIPFPDNSIDAIYSQHFLEHLSYPKEMKALLVECLRVLKRGAVFSACVPDARIFIDAYLSQDPDFFKDRKFYEPAYHYNSPIDYINLIAYMDGHHKHLFDRDNLKAILSAVGFIDVKEREFDPNMDSEGRKWQSIYVECKA